MKKLLMALTAFFSIVSLIFIIFCIIIFTTHQNILDVADQTTQKYTAYSVQKLPYILSTYVQTIDNMEFVRFRVVDSQSGDVVFEPIGLWRTMDFKGIEFAENSYDIIVKTGDLGDTVYTFRENGHWEIRA